MKFFSKSLLAIASVGIYFLVVSAPVFATEEPMLISTQYRTLISKLEGKKLTVISVNGKRVPGNNSVTFSEGRYSGQICNLFSGEYTKGRSGVVVTMGLGMSTMMYCQENIFAETALLQSGKSRIIRLRDGKYRLLTSNGDRIQLVEQK